MEITSEARKKSSTKWNHLLGTSLKAEILFLSSLLYFILHFHGYVFLSIHLQTLPLFPLYLCEQIYSRLKTKMLGPVLLLILQLLHMPPHFSTTLSNRQAGQMNYSSIRNFTFAIPLNLFSPRPLKFTSFTNWEKSLGLSLILAAEFNFSFECLSWFPNIILSGLLSFLSNYFPLRVLFIYPCSNVGFLQGSNPRPCSYVLHWAVSFMNTLQQYGQYW